MAVVGSEDGNYDPFTYRTYGVSESTIASR